MKQTIALTGEGGVLSQVNRPGAVFSIKARKVDGSITEKIGCTRLPVANGLEERKKMNRNGLLRLSQPAKSRTFDLCIDLIVEFNGMRVMHNY